VIAIPHFPELKPTALNRAVDQLLKLWPLDDTPTELPLGGAEAARIRALILATMPGTQLKLRDVRATLRLCLDDTEPPEWTSKAIKVLISMPEIPGFASLYELYAGFYTNEDLRSCTSTAYVKHPPDQRKIPLERIEKVLSNDPVGQLSWDTLVKLRPISETIASCRISKSSALSLATFDATYRIVLDDPLRKEHAAWIRTHSALQWIELLGNHYGSSRQRLHLVGKVVRAWGMIKSSVREVNAHTVMNTLFDRVTRDDMLGDPTQRKSMWDRDHDLYVLVRKWVLDKKIEDFFGTVDAVPDRKNFWRRHIDNIEDIEDFRGNRAAFAMKIGQLWFMEFGHVDNACYPYDESVFAQYYANRTWVSGLKRIDLVYNPPSKSYRLRDKHRGFIRAQYVVGVRRTLVHYPDPVNGAGGWWDKFDGYIQTYCGVTLP
jgi:hypothetical protein